MQERKCLHCQQLLQGRKGQKFCNHLCRCKFNNKQYDHLTGSKVYTGINRQLLRNWRLLIKLNAGGKTVVTKLELEKHRFDFRFFTHVYQNASGNTYYFCYDQGYLFRSEQEVLLVKQQQELNLE